MGTDKKTLEEYIKDRTIRIPCYQRGYIWGKKHSGSSGEKDDSVTFMLETLCEGMEFNEGKGKDIFVQGITVVESKDGKEFTVIDGQQRSTFFYLLLKTLGERDPFTIEYDSSCRKESLDCDKAADSPAQWLKNFSLDSDVEEDRNEPTQDVYFFKKTVRLILNHKLYKNHVNDLSTVSEYVRKHVKFLLIPISKELAVSTFKMMNGNKAIMQDYELIKADLLRRASLGTGGYSDAKASEWDNISLRSRYAHEWDRWLYWWNQREVQLMFNCSNPMGWLLDTVLVEEKVSENLFVDYGKYINCKYEELVKDSLKKGDEYNGKVVENYEAKVAKVLFSELRICQLAFETTYEDPVKYNQFGIIMRFLKKDERMKFIKDYFGAKNNERLFYNLKQYYNLLLMGYTYGEIKARKLNKQKMEDFRTNLVMAEVYGVNNELAYQYLLVRNVERDSELERKFDFSIWQERSLEHVYPKSKVVHETQDGLQRGDGRMIEELYCNQGRLEVKEGKTFNDDIGTYIPQESINDTWKEYVSVSKDPSLEEYASVVLSEHSIGNLLLLYRNENSSFGNKMPEDKRISYFQLNKEGLFHSRHLLHTVFSFGRFEKFDQKAICENQKDAIKDVSKRIDMVTHV